MSIFYSHWYEDILYSLMTHIFFITVHKIKLLFTETLIKTLQRSFLNFDSFIAFKSSLSQCIHIITKCPSFGTLHYFLYYIKILRTNQFSKCYHFYCILLSYLIISLYVAKTSTLLLPHFFFENVLSNKLYHFVIFCCLPMIIFINNKMPELHFVYP